MAQQATTIGIGGPVGSGKTALVEALCRNTNKALQEAKHRGKNQVWLYSGLGDLAPGNAETGTAELGSRESGD